MKNLLKYIFLMLVGGNTYYFIEILYRGRSHWTMFILGGMCFISLGLINEILKWETPLILQALYGSGIITVLEFITGVIVNLVLKWNVWDYSNMPFNIMGQVCLEFSLIWMIISILGIVLDDYIRYYIFHEEKPRYKIL